MVNIEEKCINDLIDFFDENKYILEEDLEFKQKWNHSWIYIKELKKLTKYFKELKIDNIEEWNLKNELFNDFILKIQLLKDIIGFFSGVLQFKLKENDCVFIFKNIYIFKENKFLKLDSKNTNDNKIFSFLRSTMVAHKPNTYFTKDRDWILNKDERLVNYDYFFIENSSKNLGLNFLIGENIKNCIVSNFFIYKLTGDENKENYHFGYGSIYFSFNTFLDYISSLYSYTKAINEKMNNVINEWKSKKINVKIKIQNKSLLEQFKLIKNKFIECLIDDYLISKIIYMLDIKNFDKKNKKLIDEFKEILKDFALNISEKIKENINKNEIEEHINSLWYQMFSYPNINIFGKENHLNYCSEKIEDIYSFNMNKTIFNIDEMNFDSQSANKEQWILRCLYVFYEFFAKKYVYMDIIKMNFNELYLLVYVAMFKHKITL